MHFVFLTKCTWSLCGVIFRRASKKYKKTLRHIMIPFSLIYHSLTLILFYTLLANNSTFQLSIMIKKSTRLTRIWVSYRTRVCVCCWMCVCVPMNAYLCSARMYMLSRQNSPEITWDFFTQKLRNRKSTYTRVLDSFIFTFFFYKFCVGDLKIHRFSVLNILIREKLLWWFLSNFFYKTHERVCRFFPATSDDWRLTEDRFFFLRDSK